VTARVRKAVRDAVKDSDLTEHKIATLAGIPKTTFGRRLDGVNPWDVAQIEAVARVIGVDPNELIPQSADQRSVS
jgi:hypothetical protein